MLEAHDEIVCKAHHYHITARLLASPSLEREVKDIVQVHVGQQRTDTAALNGDHFTNCPFPSSSTPTLSHSSMRRTTRRSPMRCSMNFTNTSGREFRKIRGCRHRAPVHLFALDPYGQRIKRLMWSTLRSKSIRETQEIALVNRIEHLDDGALEILSSNSGTRNGRCRPSVFSMYARRTGLARYAPA